MFFRFSFFWGPEIKSLNSLVTISVLCLSVQGTIASSLTCVQLHKRAEKIAAMLAERGHLQDGDHVALVYPPGESWEEAGGPGTWAGGQEGWRHGLGMEGQAGGQEGWRHDGLGVRGGHRDWGLEGFG